MAIVGLVIAWLLNIYLFVLFARMLLSWVPVVAPQWEPRGPLLVVAESIYTVTDPPLNFLRRFIPPLRLGQVALDLSFLVLWLAVLVLIQVNRAVFAAF